MSFNASTQRGMPRWLFVDMHGQIELHQQPLPRTLVASALHRVNLAPPATAEVLGMDGS